MSRYYKLTVEVVTPDFRDRVDIEAATVEELEPSYVERGGITFERYVDDDGGSVEVRLDHVVKRTIELHEDDRLPDGVKAVTRLGPAALIRGEDDVR